MGKFIHPVRFSCCCCNELGTASRKSLAFFYLFSIIYSPNDLSKLTRNVAHSNNRGLTDYVHGYIRNLK